MTIANRVPARLVSRGTWGLLAFIGGIWLMANPYFGIRHDGVLYTVQALYRLQPQIYGHDLFFRYGSQSQFTAFPIIHAWFISAVGIDEAAILLTIVGKLLWGGGLLFFLSAYLRTLSLPLGLIVLASFLPLYDGNHVFGYGESIVTSRLYAEALCLFSLGLVARGRERLGLSVVFAALFLHPLMAFSGLVAAVLLCRRYGTPLILAGLAGTAVAVVLGLLGIDPFISLVSRFDPVWLNIVEVRVPYIFLESWSPDAVGRLGLLAAILVSCGISFWGEFVGSLAARMLLLGAGSLVLAWAGSSLLHDVLLTQMQIWRGMWIVQIVSLSLLGHLSLRLWRGRTIDRMLLAFLWSALLLKGLTMGILALIGVSLWLVLTRLAPRWQPTLPVFGAIALLPLASVGFSIGFIANSATIMQYVLPRPAWQTILSEPTVAIILFGGLAWLALRQGKVGIVASGVLGALVLLVGLVAWNRQPHGVGSWEHFRPAAEPLQAIIPPTATVYWPGGGLPVWFWLHRADYVSKLHTTGALFSRETAMRLDYRQSRVLTQNLDDGYPYWQQPYFPATGDSRHPGMDAAVYLCQDPELDFLILPASKELESVAYRFVYPRDGLAHDMIDCRRMRPAPLQVGK